jgi:hypothetical protein
MCVSCGSRSKLAHKLHAARNASSGDKSTSSLASQDVDQQQATSSDGKHAFLLHKYISATLKKFNIFFSIFIFPTQT